MIIHNTNNDTIMVTKAYGVYRGAIVLANGKRYVRSNSYVTEGEALEETIKFYNKLSKVTVYGELEQP